MNKNNPATTGSLSKSSHLKVDSQVLSKIAVDIAKHLKNEEHLRLLPLCVETLTEADLTHFYGYIPWLISEQEEALSFEVENIASIIFEKLAEEEHVSESDREYFMMSIINHLFEKLHENIAYVNKHYNIFSLYTEEVLTPQILFDRVEKLSSKAVGDVLSQTARELHLSLSDLAVLRSTCLEDKTLDFEGFLTILKTKVEVPQAYINKHAYFWNEKFDEACVTLLTSFQLNDEKDPEKLVNDWEQKKDSAKTDLTKYAAFLNKNINKYRLSDAPYVDLDVRSEFESKNFLELVRVLWNKTKYTERERFLAQYIVNRSIHKVALENSQIYRAAYNTKASLPISEILSDPTDEVMELKVYDTNNQSSHRMKKAPLRKWKNGELMVHIIGPRAKEEPSIEKKLIIEKEPISSLSEIPDWVGVTFVLPYTKAELTHHEELKLLVKEFAHDVARKYVGCAQHNESANYHFLPSGEYQIVDKLFKENTNGASAAGFGALKLYSNRFDRQFNQGVPVEVQILPKDVYEESIRPGSKQYHGAYKERQTLFYGGKVFPQPVLPDVADAIHYVQKAIVHEEKKKFAYFKASIVGTIKGTIGSIFKSK